MLDKAISRFVNVFEVDDALLHTLGAWYKFKSYHPKRQGKVAYHPDTYFGEGMENIVGFSLLQ